MKNKNDFISDTILDFIEKKSLDTFHKNLEEGIRVTLCMCNSPDGDVEISFSSNVKERSAVATLLVSGLSDLFHLDPDIITLGILKAYEIAESYEAEDDTEEDSMEEADTTSCDDEEPCDEEPPKSSILDFTEEEINRLTDIVVEYLKAQK